MGTGSFQEVKQAGRGVDHPPQSSAEVKKIVKMYFYSPSGPSWSVLGLTLPLPLPLKDKNTLTYTLKLFQCVEIPNTYICNPARYTVFDD